MEDDHTFMHFKRNMFGLKQKQINITTFYC